MYRYGVVRRERDDLSRALQAKDTEMANIESSKKRMLSRKQKEVDAAAGLALFTTVFCSQNTS